MRQSPENRGSDGIDSDRIDVEMSDFSMQTSLIVDDSSAGHLLSQDESRGLMVDDSLYTVNDPSSSAIMRWFLRDPFFTRVAQLWILPAMFCVPSDIASIMITILFGKFRNPTQNRLMIQMLLFI